MRRLRFIPVGAALLFGSAVSAAPETGSRIDRIPLSVGQPAKFDAATAAATMNRFARCYAQQNKKLARSIVAMAYTSDEQNKAVVKALGDFEDCISAEGLKISFQAPAMIGGMAEQLVLEEYAKTDVRPLADISDEQLAPMGLSPRNGTENFGQCLVRKDPVAARALALSPYGQSEEAAQVKRLIPHLSPCLPDGLTLTLNKLTIRTITAISLYRLLSNTNGGAASASSRETDHA